MTVLQFAEGEHGDDVNENAAYSNNIYARAALIEVQKKVKAQLKAYLKDPNC